MVTKSSKSGRRLAVGVGSACALIMSGIVLSNPAVTAAPEASGAIAQADNDDDDLAIVSDTLVSVTPARFVDTRPGFATIDGVHAGEGKRPADSEYEITVAGRDVIPADAAAVVVNVTAVSPEGRGYVTLHPCVSPRPLASSLNYVAGVNTGNEVVAALSTDGSICAYTNRVTHLTIDVVGYVPATGEISPLVPARLLDTRAGGATVDGEGSGAGRTTAGSSLTVQVAGRGGVPADEVHSVLVNVTAVDPQERGFVVAHACLPAVPSTSSLNHVPGVNRGNELLVELSAAGEICLFTNRGVHLTVDVVSYILTGSTVATVAPSRLADSRPGNDTVDGIAAGFGKSAGGTQYTLQVTGRAGVPADAQAAIVNVTAVAPEARGYFTVHPCVPPRPIASSINYTAGVNGANELIAGLSPTGALCIFTSSNAHFTVDVVGYIANSAAPMADLSVTVSDSVDPANAGDPLTSTVTVTNTGPADAENVRVTSVLADDVTVVSTDGCDEDPAGGSTCTLGDIANGTSEQFTILTNIASDAPSGPITNTATVTSDTADPVGGNNTATEATTIQAVGTIIIEKTTEPVGGTGFGFTDDIAAPNTFTLDAGQATTFTTVSVGTYSVTEDDPSPQNLVSISCDDGASPTASTGSTITRTATIGLDPGETVTCMFLNNLNLAPTITSDGGGNNAEIDVDENQTAVTDVNSTDDLDSEGAGLTYSLSGGDDQALFTLDTTTGVLAFATPPDFENATDTDADGTYDVQTTVTDAGPGTGLTDVQDIAITVDDVNEAPVITSNGGGATAAVNAAENQTAVTDVQSADPEGDTEGAGLTYSLSGGDDQALFTLDTTTGVLAFATPPDFENATDTDADGTYDVQVTVTDSGTLTDVQDVAVTVTGTNDDPVITSDGGGATASVNAAENQTAVTTVTATDPDVPAQTLSFSITGGADQALFGLAGGVLTFDAAPDFEIPGDAGGNNVYDVQVTVTDDGTGALTDVQDIAVTVTDVNENPVITSDGGGATGSVNAAENQTAVTTVTATDPDVPAQTLSFSITGGADQALFGLAGGVLTFDAAPDFEIPGDAGGNNVYDVQVTVTDDGTGALTDVQDIAVTVTDVVFETPPTAVDDPYGATGNVSLTVPLANGVLSNDAGPALVVTEVQGAAGNVSAATDTDATGLGGVAGSVTVAADGSFTYRPPPGFVGNDTFTYEVSNGAGSDTGTATITVGDMIWFIDNSSTGANRGTLSDPFTSLASFNFAQGMFAPNAKDGDDIFISTGTSTYPGSTGLRLDQTLIGQGASASIEAITGITLAPLSDPLPTTGGASPVITETTAGDGINLSPGSTVRGLDVSNSGGGVGIFGRAGGTTAITEVSIDSTGGPALDIANTEVTISLDAATTTASPTGGIVLANVGAGSTIDLTDIALDTTGGAGLDVSGGGTLTVTGATNTIQSDGGPAVRIVGTTIGGAGPTIIGTDLTGSFGVTLRSVSVAGGTANGIVLDNAGPGGFTVTGTGTDGSGGTLANTSSDAIVLANGTANVELTNIGVSNTGRHGVIATGGVSNLVVNDSQFTDIGDANGEEAFSFDSPAGNNITGQLTLNDVDVTRFFDNGINIFATSGNVNIDVINGSDFIDGADSTAGASMGQAIIVETEGTAGADLNVDSSLFDDVETDAVRFEAGGSGANNADVLNNTVTNPGGPDNFPNGGSFQMLVTDSAALNFDIQGNVQNDLPGDGIIVAATSGGGSISGRIGGPLPAQGNEINGGVNNGGIPVSDGIVVTDVGVNATGAETMMLLIQNNTIDPGGGDDGIQFSVGDSDGTYDVTIRDNTISNTGSEGIRFFLDDDTNLAPDLDLDVTDNSFTSIGDGAIELATRESAIACANVSGNADGAAGSPGTLLFDERDTSAISIVQASLAALATANTGATIVEQTNPVTFNATCGTTLPSHP